MNFHNERDYSYAILGNEDGLVFAKNREHHRTNKTTICQGDTNMIKQKQANANIAVLNALGIPRSYSLPSNTICIISTLSNRSMVMGNHK